MSTSVESTRQIDESASPKVPAFVVGSDKSEAINASTSNEVKPTNNAGDHPDVIEPIATSNEVKQSSVQRPSKVHDADDMTKQKSVLRTEKSLLEVSLPNATVVRRDDRTSCNNINSEGVKPDPNQELEAVFAALKRKRGIIPQHSSVEKSVSDTNDGIDGSAKPTSLPQHPFARPHQQQHLPTPSLPITTGAVSHPVSSVSLADMPRPKEIPVVGRRQNHMSNEPDPRIEAKKRNKASSSKGDERKSHVSARTPRGETRSIMDGPATKPRESSIASERLTLSRDDSVEKRRKHRKADHFSTSFSQHSSVIRGSVAHKVLEKLGRLVPDCLVDDPYEIRGNAEPRDEKKQIESKTEIVDDDTINGKVQQPSLKICFRSNVLPQKSRRVPKANHRVVILQGPHRGQTGYVVDELDSKLFVVESDEVPVGLRKYTQWTVNSSHVMTVAVYRERRHIPRHVAPSRRHLSSSKEPSSSVEKELFLSCLGDTSGQLL